MHILYYVPDVTRTYLVDTPWVDEVTGVEPVRGQSVAVGSR